MRKLDQKIIKNIQKILKFAKKTSFIRVFADNYEEINNNHLKLTSGEKMFM